MKFRDRTTGEVYNSLYEVQQLFSNVSFPLNWGPETYDFVNMDPVMEIPQPQPTSVYNRVDYNGIQLVNGIWTETWVEVPRYDDTILQAEWEAECLQIQWDVIRSERNRLLVNSDYTQLADTPITTQCKTNFATYRQQLRNITTQTDPYNIVWPILPIYEKE